MKTMVLAIGGNSLIRPGERGGVSEQIANARPIAAQIVSLVRDGYRIVLTHGNGPQVGAELLLSERSTSWVPRHPLDVCDAATQGEIGYFLQQALNTELRRAGLHVPVVTVVTQCVVSLDDPSMTHLTKPVGPFYSRQEAEERTRLFGWTVVEDGARGYRRVVASPEPIEIVEFEVIHQLAARGILTIACGGGGIPVAWVDEKLQGVEAVIDKDLALSLLASLLGVELFVIATDVDCVYVDYNKPSKRALHQATPVELDAFARAGHFPAGSMGPKIEAVVRFVRRGGAEAIVTSCGNLCAAVEGAAGTHVVLEPVGISQEECADFRLTAGNR